MSGTSSHSSPTGRVKQSCFLSSTCLGKGCKQTFTISHKNGLGPIHMIKTVSIPLSRDDSTIRESAQRKSLELSSDLDWTSVS